MFRRKALKIIFITSFLLGSSFNCQPILAWENTVFDEESPFFFLPELIQINKKAHFAQILNTGEEALVARIHLIRNAKKSILMQTFIWANDESGHYILNELINAANRGVKVSLLIDKLGSADDPNLVAYVLKKAPNISIKYYNPSSDSISPSALHIVGEIAFNFKKFNQRMHNKIMVFDEQIAIAGGRNVQNDYFDFNRIRNFKDRDILIAGPIIEEFMASFWQYWDYKLSFAAADFKEIQKTLKSEKFYNQIDKSIFELNPIFTDIESKVNSIEYIQNHFIDTGFFVDQANYIVDTPGKNESYWLKGGGLAADALFNVLLKAKKSILIQSPYLVFDGYLIKAIRRIQRKNKNLNIFVSTNSLAATDHMSAYAHAFKQKKTFVKKLHFRIFEFKPVPADIKLMMPNYQKMSDDFFPEPKDSLIQALIPDNPLTKEERFLCIHAKSFVVDDEISWIGSFNLDPRSVHLNTESGVVIHDKDFSLALKKNIARDMAPRNSWTLGVRENIPLISTFSGIIGSVMEKFPVGDIWPFQYTSLFELKKDGEIVPFTHEDFHDNYSQVGSFPGVGLSTKQIQLRLIKAIIGLVKPVI